MDHALARLLETFRTVDSELSPARRLQTLVDWIGGLPDVHATRMISFDSPDGEKPAEFTFLVPARQASLFPKSPAVLNGKSPIPHNIFPLEHQKDVTVYYPLTGAGGDLVGAILVKCESPRRFLQKHEVPLGFLCSKTQDVMSISHLKKEVRHVRGRRDEQESFTPEVLGKLMGLLNVPMYVTDAHGSFLNVNDVFLRVFEYDDLTQLNRDQSFFVDGDQWNTGIHSLIEEATGGIQVRVRKGSGRIAVVRNAATLIGRNTLGILFDVDDYVRLNEELEESLESHRVLNEKLTATTSVLQKTQATAMKSLAALAEYRDLETGKHLHRIAEYNGAMSAEIYKHQPFKFNISEDYIDDMYLSSMLHDIGKVGVPDSILLKSGSLESDEWSVMKKHTIWGWTILNEADQELGKQSFLTLSARIALHHHEKWDGTGYPHGLSASEIPLSARVTAIADVYDALTSRRPYKEAWSHEQAMEEISGQSGRHFDPVLVDLLGGIQDTFKEIRRKYPE